MTLAEGLHGVVVRIGDRLLDAGSRRDRVQDPEFPPAD
jgi:hypothetical protein